MNYIPFMYLQYISCGYTYLTFLNIYNPLRLYYFLLFWTVSEYNFEVNYCKLCTLTVSINQLNLQTSLPSQKPQQMEVLQDPLQTAARNDPCPDPNSVFVEKMLSVSKK